MFVYKLSEFTVEWIPSVRNKAGTVLSSKSHLYITTTADKKIMSAFSVSGVLCSPPQSAVQVK